MKTLKTIVVLAIVAVTIVSCKKADKKTLNSSVDNYTAYIDSVSNVSAADASLHWKEIENSIKNQKSKIKKELQRTTSKRKYEQEIEKASKKYNILKENIFIEKEKDSVKYAQKALRNSLFKTTNMGDELNFNWVNKNNILGVYDQFITTVAEQKSSFSREEWDDIKSLYEMLDKRKNIVEKEGLTTSDNIKITALKGQFATMYTINGTQAKTKDSKR